MASQQPQPVSPSVLLDMAPPEVQTPIQPAHSHGADGAFRAHLQTFFPTPHQPHQGSGAHDPYVCFPPMETSLTNQSLTWETEPAPPLLPPGGGSLTFPSESSPYEMSESQCELPQVIPTPGRELTQMAVKTQEIWDRIHHAMEEQGREIKKLTQEVNDNQISSGNNFEDLGDKISTNHRQLMSKIVSQKEGMETELDKLVKEIKMVVEEELKRSEASLLSEIRFMVEQLQVELQNELKNVHESVQESTCMLSKTIDHEVKKLTTTLGKMEVEDQKRFYNLEQRTTVLEKKLESPPISSPSSMSSPCAVDHTAAVAIAPPAVEKKTHLKLTFPTYGGVKDDPDPLSYLSRCHDFLAIHPLSDADILATFRTVLQGTARDWWEIARSTVTSWSQSETAFLAAFLAEDYEDELAERVRNRKQKENETIRDFAFSYRALCKRWNSSLTESSIVKMILKNIHPFLASQLRGRVDTVEELVRLGHQLEKDHELQLTYNQRSVKPANPISKNPNSGQLSDTARLPVLCWRCKGNHSPGSCPHYHSPDTSINSPRQQGPKYPPRPQKPKGMPANGSVSLVKAKNCQAENTRTCELNNVNSSEYWLLHGYLF